MINTYSYSFHSGNSRTTTNLSCCFPTFSFLSEHNEKDWNKKHYLRKKRVFLFIHIALLSFQQKERTWKKRQSTHSFLFLWKKNTLFFSNSLLKCIWSAFFHFRWWEVLYPSKNKTNLIEKERRKFSKENHTFHRNHSFFFSSLNKFFDNTLKWSFLKANDAYFIEKIFNSKMSLWNKQTNEQTKR